MSSALHILFIPRWFPNRHDPYSGIFIKRHAMAVAQKHRVSVLYINADPDLMPGAVDVESGEEDGLFVCRVYYSGRSAGILGKLIKFRRYLSAMTAGLNTVQKVKGLPDLTHIHVLSRTFLPARHLQKKFGIPFIISEQWSGYHPEDGSYKGFLKKYLTSKAVKHAALVTTVSKSLRDAMLHHGLDNEYHIVPNVVDTQQFCINNDHVRGDVIRFLHVSNLDDRAKNVSGMLRAAAELAKGGNHFELNIIGDGPHRTRLESLVTADSQLRSKVIFHGAQPPQFVALQMNRSDYFILFSNYDNMPCVMAESFACGLPVIGSGIHGIAEHVNPATGITVKPGDERELMLAMQRVIQNKDLFDRNKIRAYAIQHFSVDAVSTQFDMLYKKALKIT